MSRILITGGTGFIGRFAVEALSQQGNELIVPTSRSDMPKSPDVTYLPCDLTNAGEVERLIADTRPDSLLHIAWRSAAGGLWHAPENMDWLRATLHLADCFLKQGGSRIVLCGSCGEYDWTGGLCAEDQTPLRPSTVYGSAKVAATHGVGAMCQISGASFAAARPFFVYGPGEASARLAASVILSLLAGEEALCSHGMQLRDFMHAEDVGRGLAALVSSDLVGEYNLGTGEAIRVKDLVQEIALTIGRPELVRLGARQAPAHEPPLIVADMQKTKASGLNWTQKYGLSEGVQNTVDWFRNH